MFSGPLQKDLFKGRWILAESFLRQNYCHAYHTRFVVFSALPICVTSLFFVFKCCQTDCPIAGYLWGRGQTECITWEFPGNSEKRSRPRFKHTGINGNLAKARVVGSEEYSGEVPSNLEEVVNIKMAAANDDGWPEPSWLANSFNNLELLLAC